MSTTLTSWVICFLLLSNAAAAQTSSKGDSAKAVLALEQLWLRSQQQNDPDLIAPFVAEKFVATQSNSKVIGKAEMLASARASKYTSAQYGDIKVALFRDAAIVIGFEKLMGIDSAGMPMDINERFTDTWVKMSDGKWQCVASQQTTNLEADAPAKNAGKQPN